jgi:putative exosortase-associated protein (TIGR04073 family)
MLMAAVAVPQSYDPDQDLPKPTKWEKRIQKLGRGLSNVLFGWSEIPLAWHRQIQLERPFTQIVTHGTVVGTSRFLIRTGLGIYETFSFYTSSKERKYDPMIEPEYLF